MLHYYIIHKPFRTLSQFSSVDGKLTLKDFIEPPGDVYPVGRLDYDSEGLLVLTNDAAINKRLLDPLNAHEREYHVQVEGLINADAISSLQKGVVISIDGKKYSTKKCKASVFYDPPPSPPRDPPVRFRKNIPTSWIKLILTEGKNRQVRKMTAAVGFPTLRLIRYRIKTLTLDGLEPGQHREINAGDI